MATPTLGSHTLGNVSGGTQIVLSGVSITNGSTILIVTATSSSVSSITDTSSNSYSQIVNQGSSPTLYVWKATGATGGASVVVTINYGASGSRSAALIEVVDPVAQDLLASGNDASSPFTITTSTLAKANELVILAGASDSSSNPATFAESTGFTIQEKQENGSTYWAMFAATKTVSDTSALTPSFTSTGASNGRLAVMSYYGSDPGATIAWFVA